MAVFDEKAATWDDHPERVARAETIAQQLKTVLDMSQFQHALEYGCGTGLLSFALQDDLKKVTLMDESTEMIKVTRAKCQAAGASHFRPLAIDLLSGSYDGPPFDFIFTLLTLHHIEDTAGILARFREQLQPGGVLAIIDLETEDGSFHDDPFTGHLGFDRTALAEQLQKAGLKPFHDTIIYHIEKGEGDLRRRYPLFLIMASAS